MTEKPTKILLVRYGADESMAAGEGNIAVVDIELDSGLGWGWVENALDYFAPHPPGELVIIVSSSSLQDTLEKAKSVEKAAEELLETVGWNVTVVADHFGFPPCDVRRCSHRY